MGFNLAGFLQNPQFIDSQEKMKRDAAARAKFIEEQAKVEALKPKASSGGGFSLGGFLGGIKDNAPEIAGNIGSGLKGTASDAAPLIGAVSTLGLSTIGRGIYDASQGNNPLENILGTFNNPLSGRRYAEHFGAGKQFNRLPDVAQTAIDVAPQAAVAAATGGATGAVPLGGLFLKQLALQTGINMGLQKASKKAQNLPGWRSLSGTNQNAVIAAGTMLGGHALGKATSKEALGNAKELGPTAVKQALSSGEQGGYKPYPEEPIDPRAAEIAGITPNTRPTDPKSAAIWDAAHNPSALGPGLSELGPITLDNFTTHPAVSSADLGDLAKQQRAGVYGAASDENLLQAIKDTNDRLDTGTSEEQLTDQSSMQQLMAEAQKRGLDIPKELLKLGKAANSNLSNGKLNGQAWVDSLSPDELKQVIADPVKYDVTPEELGMVQARSKSFPTIAGGASKWKSLFGEGPVSTVNNTIRGAHTLFDLATFGRLGPQVALRNPNEYSQAMKVAIKSIGQGREPVKELWKKIDQESWDSRGLGPNPTVAEVKASTPLLSDTTEWRKNDLSMHTPSTGLLQAVPGVRNVAGMYQNFLDALRPLIAQTEERNRIISGDMQPGDAGKLKEIAKGTNLLTGSSSLKVGKEGNLLFEFPNWLAAQGEMITKAATSGSIDGQMARQSLVRLVGLGTAVTTAANMLQGDSNPLSALTAHTRNGIPQAQIPGTDMQVDMFGPLGELISKTLGVGAGTISGGEQGGVSGAVSGASSGLGSAYRGFASPFAKIASDFLTKSTVGGERVATPTERILDVINQALPFSSAEVGQGVNAAGDALGVGSPVPKSVLGTRSAAADILGNVGLRVHEPSATVRALSDAGIKQDDPDYLIKRKEYLQAHPELQVTNDVTDAQQRIQAERTQLDSTLRNPDSGMNLVTFRDERTKILQDQRDTLKALLGDKQALPATSKQAQWLQSYAKLFDQAKNPDDPSGQTVSSDKLDPLIADWTNTNGQAALDFVNRYTSSGLSESEQSYIRDLRTLDAAGYFAAKANLYVNMKSNLSAAEIDKIHAQVEARRLQSPNPPVFAVTLAQLHPELPKAEQADIVNSTKKAYQSPALQKLKDTYRKELLWFNPRATWDTYQGAVPGAKVASSSTTSGIPKIPKLSGSLPAIPKLH